MMQPGALLTVLWHSGVADITNDDSIYRAKLIGPFNDGVLNVHLIDCPFARTASLLPENEGVTWMRGWGERQVSILRATWALQELAL